MSFKGYKRTIQIGFDYNEVKEGVKDVSKQMTMLNAEFRRASAEAKDSGTAMDRLGVRYDYLSERLKIQQGQVDEYRKRLEKAREIHGEGSKAVQQYTYELGLAETKLATTSAQLDSVSRELEKQQLYIDKSSEEWKNLEHGLESISVEYEKASLEAEKSGKSVDKLTASHDYLTAKVQKQEQVVEMYRSKLNDATNAEVKNEDAIRENSLELSKAELQLAQTRNELDKASKELEKQRAILGKTSDEWKELGEKTTQAGKNLTMKVTTPLLAAAAASFKLGADMQDALGKTETVFGSNAEIVRKWSDTALKSFGLAKVSALDMATFFGGMAQGMSLTNKQILDMSTNLTSITMDLATFHNKSIEETRTALTSIFTGETESLKGLGIVMTQAALQQHAYSVGLRKKINEMTEAEKVQLRYSYVMDQSKNVVGNYKKEQDNATAQMMLFKEATKELGTSFEKHIMPIFTPIITAVNSMIIGFSEMDDGMKKFVVTIGGLVAAVGPVLLILGGTFGAISNVRQGMKDAGDMMDKVKGVGSKVGDVIEAIGDKGVKFGKSLDMTKFFGFAKWALIIAGVAAAIGYAIYQLNVLLGKGQQANQALNNINNITNAVNGASVRGNAAIQGSHRSGLARVPHDGYVAELHKDEEVLTANDPRNQNNRYRSASQQTQMESSNMNNAQFSEMMNRFDKMISTFEGMKQAYQDSRRFERMGRVEA